MPEQVVSESGAVYARGGHVAKRASRPIASAGGYSIVGLQALGATRPLSEPGWPAGVGGFVREGAVRASSQALSRYVSGGVISLLNLRILSHPLEHYTSLTLIRSSPTRLISPVYPELVPPPSDPTVDDTPPVVGNFSPAPGTPIARMAPVSFDVTDDSGELRLIFIVAFFPSTGVTEVVHDGAGFRGFYAASSSRVMIAGGFRYTVLRSGGWLAAPTIQTFALDRAGNEAS